MPVTNYATLDGEIVSESRSETRRDYLPDPLGSIAALLDSTQTKTDTWTYWPYGEERTRTGTTATPFQFVGTLGYCKDDSGRLYVRARHYRPTLGRWQSVDPLWPQEEAYGYVNDDPVGLSDPSGLQVYGGWCGPQSNDGPEWCIDEIDQCCKTHDKCFERHGCTALNQIFFKDCLLCNAALCWCSKSADCSTALNPGACRAMREVNVAYACFASSGPTDPPGTKPKPQPRKPKPPIREAPVPRPYYPGERRKGGTSIIEY